MANLTDNDLLDMVDRALTLASSTRTPWMTDIELHQHRDDVIALVKALRKLRAENAHETPEA